MDVSKQQSSGTIDADRREDALVEGFGYTVSYDRVFKSLGSMSLTLAMASPMLGVFVMNSLQIGYGGYFGMTWGWVIPAILYFPWALGIAELASAMPVNGGSYWWVAALAPPSLSRPLSFITGVTNFMNALTSMASFGWAIANSLVALISIHTGWEATNAYTMGIAIALAFLWLAMTCMRMQDSNTLYITCASVVLVTTTLFLVGLPVTHSLQHLPFTKASQVFGSYSNFSDWQKPVALPYTFLAAAWVITGWNASTAIAEETHNARRVVPRSVITTYLTMSVMGFFVCLVLSFCMTDLEAAASDPSGYPAFTLIINHWGKNLGFAFLLIVLVNSMLGGASVLFMVSCQTAAFARDGGLIFNDKLAKVWTYSNMPIYSSVLVTIGGVILLFLAMSPIASSIIYSLAVIAVMLMYALPMSFRVFHGGRWVPGPWNYGRFSIPIHVYSIISILYITILECFPPMANWTGATFNYNWVVLIFALFLSGVLWMFKGRYTYKGVDQEALDAWRAQEALPSTSEDDIEGANIVIQGTSPRGSSCTAGNSVHTVVKGLKN